MYNGYPKILYLPSNGKIDIEINGVNILSVSCEFMVDSNSFSQVISSVSFFIY